MIRKSYEVYCLMFAAHIVGFAIYLLCTMFSYVTMPNVQVCWRFYALMLIGIFGKITSMYYLLVLRDRCRKLWKKDNPSPRINIEAISSSVITNDLTSAISFGKLTEYDLPPSYAVIEIAKKEKEANEAKEIMDVKLINETSK